MWTVSIDFIKLNQINSKIKFPFNSKVKFISAYFLIHSIKYFEWEKGTFHRNTSAMLILLSHTRYFSLKVKWSYVHIDITITKYVNLVLCDMVKINITFRIIHSVCKNENICICHFSWCIFCTRPTLTVPSWSQKSFVKCLNFFL